MKKFGSLLLAGLAAVVPVVGTIWLIVIVYQVLLKAGDLMMRFALDGVNLVRSKDNLTLEDFDFYGADAVRFLIPVLLLFLVGLTVTNKPGRAVLHWVNRTLESIPYLGFIYSGLKQFVDALKNLGGDRNFKSVAYVEYPSPGCRMLGFVTGNYHDSQTEKDVTTVFIPTSPNPMTGFVIIIDDEKVHHSEMSLEEASKMVLSAGIVAPASFKSEAD